VNTANAPGFSPEARRAIVLATGAFALCFAVWGTISALAPFFKTYYGLSHTQVSLLIAIPVLLGSVLRLPMGMLADRFGGRAVFSILLFFCVLPCAAIGFTNSYSSLLFWALWLGMAGTSFSVGVAFVSPQLRPEMQGYGLGIYGAGNIGQSIAVFFVPVLARYLGWRWPYWIFAAAVFLWAFLFAAQARNAPLRAQPPGLRESLRVLYTRPLTWVLSLFYFLTFGGFVALGLYLPTLLKELFQLTPEDAGARTAGFVLLATAARPVGGWLSDRVSGARILAGVFAAVAVLAYGLTSLSMVLFTIGALGIATALGLGNGAVFKLVPQFFPHETGTVTGLVGAMGGLGGFFPPLVLGVMKQRTDSYTLGFALLSLYAVVCLAVNVFVFLRRPRAATSAVG
jgi:NNP family nitrate/nitrite transporter-like MFS transporter